MNIIFFGEAYVKATKRNEDEKAKRYHNALIASERELQHEMRLEEQKKREREEKKLAAKAEAEAKTQEALIASKGGAKATDVLAGLMQRPSAEVDLLEEKPAVGKSMLERTKRGLEAKSTLPSDMKLPSAMGRLREGAGRVPTRPELVQQQAGRGTEQRPARGYPTAGGVPEMETIARQMVPPRVEMPGVDVVGQPMERRFPRESVRTPRPSPLLSDVPEVKPAERILTPDQQRATQQTELALGLGDQGNLVQSSVTLPAKTQTAKIPQIAVDQVALIFNEKYPEAEQKAADILEVLIKMNWEDAPKDLIVPGSKKDLAERYKKFNENLETKLVTGLNGEKKLVTYNNLTSKVLNQTVLYPGEGERPVSLEDYQSLIAEYGEGLRTQIRVGITTNDEVFKMISKLDPRLRMKDLTHISTQKNPLAAKITNFYRNNNDPTGDIVKLITPYVPPPIDSDKLSNFARLTGKSFAPSTTWQDIEKMGIMIPPPILDNDRMMKGSELQWLADNTGIEDLVLGMSRNQVIKKGDEQGITITAKELTPTFKTMFYDEQGYAFGLYLDHSGSVSHTEPIKIDQPDGTKVHLRKPLTSANESSDPSVAYNRFLTNRFRQLGSYDVQAEQYGKIKSTFDDIIDILNGSKGPFKNQEELEGLVNAKRISFEEQTRIDKNGIKTTYWQLVKDRELVANPETINVHTQALIMLYNRLLDPLSTVRSEEFGRMALGLSVAEKAQGFWLKFTRGGGGIGLGTIQAIKDSADGLFKDTLIQYRGRTWPTINAAINYSDPESKLYFGEGYNINMFLDQSHMSMWTSAEHPINMSSNLEAWKKARDYWRNSTKITVPEDIPGKDQKDRKVNKAGWLGRGGG